MCQCGLHAVHWSHISILIRLLAAEPPSTTGLLSLSVTLWNDLADPVFDGVGLAVFKSRVNALLLVYAARSVFVFSSFLLSLISFNVLVLWGRGLRSDMSANRSLPAWQRRPSVIIITLLVLFNTKIFFGTSGSAEVVPVVVLRWYQW